MARERDLTEDDLVNLFPSDDDQFSTETLDGSDSETKTNKYNNLNGNDKCYAVIGIGLGGFIFDEEGSHYFALHHDK